MTPFHRSCSPRRSRGLTRLAACLVLCACNGDDIPGPKETIRVHMNGMAGTASLEADGFSQVRITAEIPSLAPASTRKLRFSTTSGRFVGVTTIANSRDREVELEVDAVGTATLSLESGTIPDTAIVTVSSTGVRGVVGIARVAFVALSDTSVVRFTGGATTIPADGLTTTTIGFRLDPRIPTGSRSAVVKTTAGSFTSGTLAENGLSTTVVVDASNTASVTLRSPIVPAEAIVRVTVLGVTRELPLTIAPITIGDYLRIVPIAGTLEADGATLVPIDAWISQRFQANGRAVRFEAAGAQFVVNGDNAGSVASVLLGQQDTVRAFLRSPATEGIVNLRVVVGDLTTTHTLTFARALPDAIVIDPGKLSMKVTEETTVTANLLRRTGMPSPNLTLLFEAFDAATGVPLQGFRGQTPGSAGKATAVFAPIGMKAPGNVRLRVSTIDGSRVGEAILAVTL